MSVSGDGSQCVLQMKVWSEKTFDLFQNLCKELILSACL